MTQTTLPNFTELNLILTNNGVKQHPSETHGMICGIICSNRRVDNWEKQVINHSDINTQDELHTLLQDLYQKSEHYLDDFLFEFQLILPDDIEDLALRAEALTLWCQGFLMGLQFANITVSESTKAEISEPLDHLLE